MERECDKFIIVAINRNHIDMDKEVRGCKNGATNKVGRVPGVAVRGDDVKSFVATTMTVAEEIDGDERCKTTSVTGLVENLE
ncbi:hypothetical protein AHAS_Ahas05G0216900 [Arachis hypogaea]